MPRGLKAWKATAFNVCKLGIEASVNVLWTMLKCCNGSLPIARLTPVKPCFWEFKPISFFSSWEMAVVI